MNRNYIVNLLHNAGLRSTPARRALLIAMHGSGPLREDEIAERLGDDAPDTATLYRNLDTLVKAGLMRRHTFGNRAFYFSLHIPGGNSCAHAHFICESCGNCECLTGTIVPTDIIDTKGRVIRGVELVINGICKKCVGKS